MDTESKQKVTVALRPQTPEEKRQLEQVLELFLSEMVRQHFENRHPTHANLPSLKEPALPH